MEFRKREKRPAVIYGRVTESNKKWFQAKAEELLISESELLNDILSHARDDRGQKKRGNARKAE